MAFVVENGSGLSNANAYLSEAEANTYNSDHAVDAAWSAASTEDKEKSIRLATQYIDARYIRKWFGRRVQRDQALDWPRTGVVDADRFLIDSDIVPQEVKDATAEMALRSLKGEDLMPDIANPGSITSERVKVDVIEEETRYSGGRSQIKRFRLVDNLLRGLVSPVGFMERA